MSDVTVAELLTRISDFLLGEVGVNQRDVNAISITSFGADIVVTTAMGVFAFTSEGIEDYEDQLNLTTRLSGTFVSATVYVGDKHQGQPPREVAPKQ